MIDMRYHVISLVAVFLALGIGVLLGTTLVERGLIAEQKAEIRSLRKTFDEIKEKNRTLHDDNKVLSDFASQSRVYLLSGRLTGKPFAAITRDKPDEGTLGIIYDTISAAGGVVPVTITVAGPEVFEDPTVVNNLGNFFAAPPQADVLKGRVFAELTNQLVSASNPSILIDLQKLGVIRIRGVFNGPVSGGIMLPGQGGVVGGSVEKIDSPLLKSFLAAGFPVVGVGSSKTEDSVLVFYKKTGISTVGRVDTVPGQVAMVMVLAGKPGNYGSGKAAGRVIP